MGEAVESKADYCETYHPSTEAGAKALRDRLMDVAGLSEIFRVLGDETRTRIVYLVSLQELCVCDLAEIMEMSLPAVSHHLRLLKMMRLVKYRRKGKKAYYSLDDEHIVSLIRQAQAHYEEQR